MEYVRRLLGHKSILNTQLYVNMEKAFFTESSEDYAVKVASTVSTGEQWGFAIRKDDTALLGSLNEAMRGFKGSAGWEALIVKYFGQ